MKNRLIYIVLLLACIPFFYACEQETTPESIRIQHPDDQSPILRDDAYYARLRAYKLTDHKKAFGWYGSWTAIGSTEQSRLSSAPDSMDIISIWSQWHSLNQAQIADKAFVQKIKGTKVVICISARDVPAEFKEDGKITDAALAAYAKAWGKDSMDKYEYDGIDIDFEMAIDHQGPLNTTPGAFKKFAQQLSQYIGPASGTGRLFLIDGNIDMLDQGIAELCTYAVSQAYNSSRASDLDYRTTSSARSGWKAEQIIFTENFESLWQSGGANYTNAKGESMPSLLGMADYAKTSKSAGFGSYHMEYEYGHKDMPYKYMRRAIQLANPAPKGDYTKNLVSINEAGEQPFTITLFPSGKSDGEAPKIETTLTASLSSVPSTETNIALKVDNSLIAPYNDYNYTEYQSLDPALVTISAPLHFAAKALVTDAPVTVSIPDFSTIKDGEYMVPIVVDFSNNPQFSINTNKNVKYLIIKKQTVQNEVSIVGANVLANTVVAILADGTIAGTVQKNISATLNYKASEATSFSLVVDQTLISAYNTLHGTNYGAVAAADITLTSPITVNKGEKTTSTASVSMANPNKLPAKESMIAVRLDVKKEQIDYVANEKFEVFYLLISQKETNIEEGVTSIDGTPIADMSGWGYSVDGYTSGLTENNMFNGNNTELGWYSSELGMYTVNVDMAKSQHIIGWRMSPILGDAGYTVLRLYNIQTSVDGKTWTRQSYTDVVAIGAVVNRWQYVKFIKPVDCRYVRMQYNNAAGSSSNGWIGCCEFNAITPKN
ncbi:MAG: glycoside hydrolase family 18 [Alistipes sp.]